MSDSDEDLEMSKRTWDKIASNVRKEGYREGVSDGRDEARQNGFDLGYAQGFNNAYRMGLVNGALRAANLLDKQGDVANDSDRLVFREAEKGLCIACTGATGSVKLSAASALDRLASTSVRQIVQSQTQHFQRSFNSALETCRSPTLHDLVSATDSPAS